MEKIVSCICGFWIIVWLSLTIPFFLVSAILYHIAGFGAFILKDPPDLLLPNWMKRAIVLLDGLTDDN